MPWIFRFHTAIVPYGREWDWEKERLDYRQYDPMNVTDEQAERALTMGRFITMEEYIAIRKAADARNGKSSETWMQFLPRE